MGNIKRYQKPDLTSEDIFERSVLVCSHSKANAGVGSQYCRTNPKS